MQIFSKLSKNRLFFQKTDAFPKKNLICFKIAKVNKFASIATERVNLLKTFRIGSFIKKKGFSEKKLNFFKIDKGRKLVAECDGDSKFPENDQNSGFYKKKRRGFRKKIDFFQNQ